MSSDMASNATLTSKATLPSKTIHLLEPLFNSVNMIVKSRASTAVDQVARQHGDERDQPDSDFRTPDVNARCLSSSPPPNNTLMADGNHKNKNTFVNTYRIMTDYHKSALVEMENERRKLGSLKDDDNCVHVATVDAAEVNISRLLNEAWSRVIEKSKRDVKLDPTTALNGVVHVKIPLEYWPTRSVDEASLVKRFLDAYRPSATSESHIVDAYRPSATNESHMMLVDREWSGCLPWPKYVLVVMSIWFPNSDSDGQVEGLVAGFWEEGMIAD
jgi:hypothetical protein